MNVCRKNLPICLHSGGNAIKNPKDALPGIPGMKHTRSLITNVHSFAFYAFKKNAHLGVIN